MALAPVALVRVEVEPAGRAIATRGDGLGVSSEMASQRSQNRDQTVARHGKVGTGHLVDNSLLSIGFLSRLAATRARLKPDNRGKFVDLAGTNPEAAAFMMVPIWTLRMRLAIGRGPGIPDGILSLRTLRTRLPKALPWYPGGKFGRQGPHPHRAPCLSYFLVARCTSSAGACPSSSPNPRATSARASSARQSPAAVGLRLGARTSTSSRRGRTDRPQ